MPSLLLALSLLAQDKGIEWRKDYPAALQEALKAGRYLVLHFAGPDCPPCKQMDEITYKDAAVIEYCNRSFVNVSIYLDVEKPEAKQFGIEAIPTTFLLAPDGTRVRKWEGYQSPKAYRDALAKAAAAHAKLKDVAARLKADPADAALNREAAGLFADLGRAREAADAYRRAAKDGPPKQQAEMLARALGQLSEVEVDDKLNAEILELATALAALDPDGKLGFADDALAARAQIALNNEKAADAARLYEEIVAKHPEGDKAPFALLWLGELYHHHLKDQKKAKAALQRLIEKYPGSEFAEDAKAMLEHFGEHGDK